MCLHTLISIIPVDHHPKLSTFPNVVYLWVEQKQKISLPVKINIKLKEEKKHKSFTRSVRNYYRCINRKKKQTAANGPLTRTEIDLFAVGCPNQIKKNINTPCLPFAIHLHVTTTSQSLRETVFCRVPSPRAQRVK